MSKDKSLAGIIDSDSTSLAIDPAWLASLPRGKINIEIKANGEWIYNGEPFHRKSMVELLARQLIFHEGKYCLVAPEQLLSIVVEDCPFVITLVEAVENDSIAVTTNTGDRFILGEKGHDLSLLPLANESMETPVVEVRPGLLARFSRAAYYQLVDMAEEVDADKGSYLQIRSAGSYHLLGYIDDTS